VDIPLLDISFKWNHTIHVAFCAWFFFYYSVWVSRFLPMVYINILFLFMAK
jgi:hypothetical protein